MAFIDSTALNVVLPSLQQDLNAKGTDLFWLLNAYLLMLAALVLVGGALGDKRGRKKVFLIGIMIFMAASAACGFAPDINFLIAFRAVQGLGGALMIPGSLSIISASFSAKERGKAIGTWSAVTTLVTVGGPVLGGALADAGLWRMIFFINIPIGLASLLILWKKVPESRNDAIDHALDYPGAIATVTGLALLTFGFLRIPEVGFSHWQVYTSLAGGLLAMVIFIGIERRSAHPMVPLKLFRNRTFSGANLLTFFLYAGLSAGILFLTLNLIQVQGYSQLQAGLTLLPFTVLMASIARWAGGLVDRYGPRWLLTAGPAAAGTGLLMLSFVQDSGGPAYYWTTYFPGIVVFALGMSFTVAPLTATVMGAVSNHYAGTASGVNNAMTRTANVFANAIMGALAILFFSTDLKDEMQTMPLNQQAKEAVMAEASNLGEARVPSLIAEASQKQIAQAIDRGFTDTYAKILQICAALAWLAALAAFLMIDNCAVEAADGS